MKTRHPSTTISSVWGREGEAGTEPLTPLASRSTLLRIPSLEGLFCEPLLDSTLLLARAFPVSRLSDRQDAWQCPGVKPGSCISSLRVLCWPSVSTVCIHLLLSPFHIAELGVVLSPGGSPYCSVPTREETNQEQRGKIWSVSMCFQVINMQANVHENEC